MFCQSDVMLGRRTWQELELVGDKDAGGVAQEAADAAAEEVLPHVRVHCREWVIQQANIGAYVTDDNQTRQVIRCLCNSARLLGAFDCDKLSAFLLETSDVEIED